MHFSGEDQCCGSEMPAEMRDEKIVAVRCQLKCGVGCHNNRQLSTEGKSHSSERSKDVEV